MLRRWPLPICLLIGVGLLVWEPGSPEAARRLDESFERGALIESRKAVSMLPPVPSLLPSCQGEWLTIVLPTQLRLLIFGATSRLLGGHSGAHPLRRMSRLYPDSGAMGIPVGFKHDHHGAQRLAPLLLAFLGKARVHPALACWHLVRPAREATEAGVLRHLHAVAHYLHLSSSKASILAGEGSSQAIRLAERLL